MRASSTRVEGITHRYIPQFLAALLQLEDCAATRLYLARPECFLFSRDFLIMPNPGYLDVDALIATTPASHVRACVRAGLGFGLVCWWVHPELQKRSRFFRCHADLRVASRRAAVRNLRTSGPL